MKRLARFFLLTLCSLLMFASPMEVNAATSKKQSSQNRQEKQQRKNTSQKKQSSSKSQSKASKPKPQSKTSKPKAQPRASKPKAQSRASKPKAQPKANNKPKAQPNKPKASKPNTQNTQKKPTTANQRPPAATNNTVNQNNYQNAWAKSTFPNNQASIQYHTNKHGNGRSELQYTRDAANFHEANKNSRQATTLNNGEAGYRINNGTQGGIWTNDGKIVTYWD